MYPELSPYDFFYNLLFQDGIKNLLSKFYNNEELLNAGYIFISEHDCYLNFEMVEDSENAQFTVDEITKEKFLILEVRKFCILWLDKIKDGNLKTDLNQTLNHVLVIYNKALACIGQLYNIITEQLLILIKDLRLFLPDITHKVFNVLIVKDGTQSYFFQKDLNYNFFRELYNISYSLDLIDEVEISEELFYEVFTCITPSTTVKIQFIKSNPIIAYFLKKLEKYFNNFTPATIEKSESFLNKQGKPIRSSDLYTALSRKSEKDTIYFSKIDKALQSLDRYLKK